MVIIFPLLTFITWNFHEGCYGTFPLGGTPSLVFNDTYKQQYHWKQNILPMKHYNTTRCNIYNDHCWRYDNHTIYWRFITQLIVVFTIQVCINIVKTHKPNKFYQPSNKEGQKAHILLAISHVASSGPKCFHFTLTSSIARFRSMSCFHCNMHYVSVWNSPSGSTCNTDQSITWSTSWTHLLSNETWEKSWTFTIGDSESL